MNIKINTDNLVDLINDVTSHLQDEINDCEMRINELECEAVDSVRLDWELSLLRDQIAHNTVFTYDSNVAPTISALQQQVADLQSRTLTARITRAFGFINRIHFFSPFLNRKG